MCNNTIFLIDTHLAVGMADVAQIQPEHFVPVKEKRMKIEREFKRKPLVA